MLNAKAAARLLVMVAALLALGHLAYSFNSAVKKKAHPHKVSKRKPTRKPSKSRRPTPPAFRVRTPFYTVIATTYQAVPSQTDRQPFLTADHSTIKRGYSSRQHWLAVSRDLLKQGGGRIQYGDRVHVRGVSPGLDGVYTVHDTMHRRHRHRIDILSNPREKLALSTSKVRVQLLGSAASKRPGKRAALVSSHSRPTRRVASRPARGHRAGAPGGLAT